MPPPRLPDYQLGEVVGVGTVGTIYQATDIATGNEYAVKCLHASVNQDEMIRARFRRETMILERLDHPNIVKCFGGGEHKAGDEEKGRLYYVMELVEGGTLKELLQMRGQFDWKVVIEVGRQLCSALQFAHNHGVVHRDLKPSNFFVTREGQIKLGDFGIARDLHAPDIAGQGITVGTHAYMAPEQIRGERSVSGKSDLYSLGCCLYEMLVGQTPFVGETRKELFDQHLTAEAPKVSSFVECPKELEVVITSMLAKSPEDRPFNARAVQRVMLELAESLGKSIENGLPSNPGSSRLKEYVLRLEELRQPKEVNWSRLAIILLFIVIIILIAAQLK